MSKGTVDPSDQLSEIESRLTEALDRSDDETQRYHIRKAAQRVVLAQESGTQDED